MSCVIRMLRRVALFGAALAVAPWASAAFHAFQIEQLYSNADGTVQFIVMHESLGANGEGFWQNHEISSTHAGVAQHFRFTSDLPAGPTARRRVLLATQGFAALGLVTPDFVIPDGFLSTGQGLVNYADVDFVGYASLPTDGVGALNRNGAVVPNVATNFAGKTASVGPPAPPVFGNFQGLWWNDPPGSESGWGINLNHQDTTIFATWFTFGLNGKPTWFAGSASSSAAAPNVFEGSLFTGTGPPFNAFDPSKVAPTQVGTITFAFTDATHATFTAKFSGITVVKPLTRQEFGSPVPTCTFGAQPNLALATNYQDIWWRAPAGSESGWGVNFTHQGDTIFATWFTFGQDGKPLWFAVAASKSAPNVYQGTLFKAVSGPPFSAVPFDPADVVGAATGPVTLTFTDGNNATFAYSVDGSADSKPITRQVLAAPGTVCR